MNDQLPLPTNLNWAALLGALATIGAYVFPKVPANVREAIMTVIGILLSAVVIVLHTFVNHPAMKDKAQAMVQSAVNRAVSTGRRSAATVLTIFGVALFLAPLLGACASTPGGGIAGSPDLQTSIAQIGAFTITDLQNANAIAQTNNDALGTSCYNGLITFVQQEQSQAGSAAGSTVSGAFSAFELARTSLNSANNLISRQQLVALETACGPLVLDTQNNAAQFLASVAALGKL